MELGVINADFKSNISDIANPSMWQALQNSVSLIKKFSESAQRLLQNILYNMNSSSPYKCVFRTPEFSMILFSGLLMEVELHDMQLSFYKFTDFKKRPADIVLTCPIRKKQELIDLVFANASDRISDLCYDSTSLPTGGCSSPRRVHTGYSHPTKPEKVTIPFHCKDIPKGTENSILKQAGPK